MCSEGRGGPPEPRHLLVLGAGGAAREIADFAPDCVAPYHAVAFVVADDEPSRGGRLTDLPILALHEAKARFPDAHAVIAIGNGAIRRRLATELAQSDIAAATLIHRSAIVGKRVLIGHGTILSPRTVVSCDVSIGAHVYVNLACTISHDSVVHDFVTLSPGVSVTGAIHLESGAFVGAGVSFVHGQPDRPLRVGRDATIGAGACVVDDIAPRNTVVGVPARPRNA